MHKRLYYILFFCCVCSSAQQLGDTLSVGNKKIVLSSTNLIPNPGFENGFTGWTDGTLAPLSSNNFTVSNSGGVNNSKYLIGTTNSGNTTAGALATGWSIAPQKTYYFSYYVKYQNASTSPTPEIWLKTSLTSNSNFQEETFKLIDTTYVNGGGAWTKNEIAFTNSNAYAYLVARFRWLNNRFGFDNFALHEATEIRNTEGLESLINEANSLYNASSKRANELLAQINKAKNLLPQGTIEQLNQAIADLQKEILFYKIANATGKGPSVTSNPNFARGATMIFARSTINTSLTTLKEHGFCWSTQPEPTIFDNRSTQYLSNNGNIYQIKNLTPSTVYYIRAYALTHENAVSYGEILKVITIPMGSVSYSLSDNVIPEHRTRIDNAMANAVGYYNQLTSIKNFSLSVNYGSGTPTAEASYGGWMRFGPSASYQQTGTALHEMAHTIGVGTHALWSGPTSPLRETGSSGAWLGDRATKLLQFIDNDPASYLRGDATHMWPYGINGAQEDNGTELLYVSNALIAQALGEDGLPPTGGFATPAYTFNREDNTKYYLKSEDKQTGLLTSFVVQDLNGNLVNRTMTADAAILDDYAAWHIDFNPVNAYYTLKNVATGRYFTYAATGNNGIKTIVKSTPSTNEYFQIMKSRIDVNYENFATRGYWIIHPENNGTPASFTANTSEITSTSKFNIANSSTTQRWLLLSKADLEAYGLITSTQNNATDSHKNLVYVQNNEVHIDGLASDSDIKIYTIDGKLLLEEKDVAPSFSKNLPKGMYLILIKSDTEQEVKKIMME